MSLNKSILVSTVAMAAVLSAVPALAQQAPAPAQEDVQEVVVTGVRASLRASIDSKRKADNIVEAITAEDIGKFPDKNVAESLQRITGISVQRDFGEGERISIRGAPPALNRTLLNGHGVATADWFIKDQWLGSRSFNYLMLPSEIVGRLEVFKSPQADIDEGGIGGAVNVQTRKPLDLPEFKFNGSVGTSFSEMADKNDPQFSGFVSWRNKDRTLGVLVAYIDQKRSVRRDGVEVLGMSPRKIDAAGKTLVAPDLIGSSHFNQERHRRGVNLTAQWRPTEQLDVNFTGLYSKMDADNYNHNYMAWVSNTFSGGSLPTKTVEVDGALVAAEFAKSPNSYGAVYDALLRVASTDVSSYTFDAKYRLNENWTIDGLIGTTKSTGATKDQLFWETQTRTGFTYDLRGGVPKVRFTDIDPTKHTALDELGWASRYSVTTTDEEFYTFANAERTFDEGVFKSVKFGVKYTDHDRKADSRYGQRRSFFTWAGLPLTTCNDATGKAVTNNSAVIPAGNSLCSLRHLAGGTTPSDYLSKIGGGALNAYALVDEQKLKDIYNSLPVGTASPNWNHFGPNESFEINEQALGGYVMGKLQGEGWRGNVGLRIVRTKQTSKGWAVGVPASTPNSVDNPFGRIAPVTYEKTYTDVLPSINLTFDLQDDLLLRVAAARVMARPSYGQLSPQVSFTEATLVGSGSNPFLDPYRATQFDVSTEWYFAPESLLSVAFFYKDVQSYIVSKSARERHSITILDPNDARLKDATNACVAAGQPQLYTCSFNISRPSNGGGGQNHGMELSYQQPIWNGFGIQANYTYSDAKADGKAMPGNSRNSYNLSAFYENERLSARLSYNYRSEFFIDVDDTGRDLWSDPVKSLDASASLNVTDNVSVTFEAQNLTDETLFQYYDNKKSRPARVYANGRQYFFAVRLSY
ncbi:MAG: TonB-dependent receptor [Asticcacaulis sp.]